MSDEITINPGRPMSNARELSQLPNASLGFKNRLINGDFRIAQRTTGSSATPSAGATSYQAPDRWFVAQTGTTAQLNQRQIAGQESQFAGRFGRVSGQTNVPTTIFMGQQIESHNMYDLRGKRVTLSFKAYRGANAPTTLLARARFGTGTDQASGGGITGSWTGFTQGTQATLTSVSTTPQFYTLSFDVPSDANEMNVLFFYTPTGTAGAEEWFGLEDVQLELGSVATEFDRRDYTTELALAQRYYIKYGPQVSGHNKCGSGYVAASTTGVISFVGQNMRTAPTVGFSSAQVTDASANAAITSVAGVNIHGCGANVEFTGSGGGLTVGRGCAVRFDPNGFIDMSSEL
jgi:hypothetical protein